MATLTPPLRKKCLGALRTICGRQSLLPRSVQIAYYHNPLDEPLYRGGYADIWAGEYQDRKVAVKVLRTYTSSDVGKIIRVCHYLTLSSGVMEVLIAATQRFCKEVVMWKTLDHQNVLPLLGARMERRHFVMISEWMDNGNINEFVKAHRGVNRFELVGPLPLPTKSNIDHPPNSSKMWPEG